MSKFNISPVFSTAAGVFISLSAWCTVYLVLCAINPKRRAEWHCRITTVVHAVLVCSLSLYAACVQGPWPFTEPGGPTTPLQKVTSMICLGYFLFDFAWCLSFNTEGPVMLTHHALTILGLSVTLLRGYYGTEMMASIFGSEITNPLLQLRWFLRETGRKNTQLAWIVNVLFVLTFGIFRIGIGSYLLHTYWQHPRPDWLGRLGGTVLYLIGWVFWIQICAYSYKKLFWRRREHKITELDEKNGLIQKNGIVDAPTCYKNNCLNGGKSLKND